MATPYNRPVSATAAEREAYIVAQRAARVPFRLIAAELGVSLARVSQVHKRAIDRVPVEAVGAMRAQESELCDRAISNLLEIAENERVSPRTRCEAWGQIRSWSESKRRLFGIDAPVRREINIISEATIDTAIENLTREMSIMDAQAKAAGLQLH